MNVKNIKTNIKPAVEWFKTTTIVLTVGFAAGAYLMHSYDTGQAKTTDQAIQEALKSIPTAQAASKTNGR